MRNMIRGFLILTPKLLLIPIDEQRLIHHFKSFILKLICRVDYIIKNNLPYIIEINTVPGLSNESIIPKQLKCMNISLSEIFKISIENATFNE